MYKKSTLITGQTQGIVKDISTRFPAKQVYWLPNGVDLFYFDQSKVETGWRQAKGFKPTDFLVLYAGIIGHAQGLEIMVEAAEKLKEHKDIFLLMVGDGPVKPKLLEQAENAQLKNILFFDSVTKYEMPGIVKDVDVAAVPLKKLPLFEGAIPSKIFENLAMEKPILLGVDGEAKEFGFYRPIAYHQQENIFVFLQFFGGFYHNLQAWAWPIIPAYKTKKSVGLNPFACRHPVSTFD